MDSKNQVQEVLVGNENSSGNWATDHVCCILKIIHLHFVHILRLYGKQIKDLKAPQYSCCGVSTVAAFKQIYNENQEPKDVKNFY